MMDRFILRAQNRAVLPNGTVLHSAAVGEGDMSLLFLAPSGGGKSTMRTRLTKKTFAGIGDDSVVVARGTDGVIRCLPCGSMKQGTGIENIGGAPLKAVFFIEKGSPGRLLRLSPSYAFYRAVRINPVMAWWDLDPLERSQALGFLRELFHTFPSYMFRYGETDDPSKMLEWTLE